MVKIKIGEIYWNSDWEKHIEIMDIIDGVDCYVRYRFIDNSRPPDQVIARYNILINHIKLSKAYNTPLWKVMNS